MSNLAKYPSYTQGCGEEGVGGEQITSVVKKKSVKIIQTDFLFFTVSCGNPGAQMAAHTYPL